MGCAYKKYDDEFKKIVISHVKNGQKPAEVARLFGISAPNIRYWIQKLNEEAKDNQEKSPNKMR